MRKSVLVGFALAAEVGASSFAHAQQASTVDSAQTPGETAAAPPGTVVAGTSPPAAAAAPTALPTAQQSGGPQRSRGHHAPAAGQLPVDSTVAGRTPGADAARGPQRPGKPNKTVASQQPTEPNKAGEPEKPRAPFGEPEPCVSQDAEEGDDLSTSCAGVFGLRGSLTHSRGAPSDDAFGLTVATGGEQYVRRGLWTSRGLHLLAIGGGSAGFEGILQGAWAGGVRLPVIPGGRQGPVLRLGMAGSIRGNDAYYGSLLELPQFQAGYQYMLDKYVVELGVTAGAVLIGRSRTGDSERRVLGSGFERGGYAAVQLPWLRLGVSGSRLPVNDDLSTPVDVLEGSLCLRMHGFALCGDGRATRTDAIVATHEEPTRVRSLYAGITLGVTRE